MIRYIRYGALLGAVMMGAGCQESAAPAESNVVPRPTYIAEAEVPSMLVTRASGVAWDPEAFFFHLAMCGGPTCPIPPFLSEGIPHYLRSAVRGATIMAFDPEKPGPTGDPVTTDNLGIWLLPTMPARYGTPFLTMNTGSGALPPASEPLGPPFPLAPITEYVPTVTARPIFTGQSGTCPGLDNAHIGKNGILEAVAKHLTAQSTGTTVADLLDPTKYWGVNVFWLYIAGNPVLRVPADGISLAATQVVPDTTPPQEAPVGQILAVDWAPPGVLPPELNQSARGFYVTNSATSSLGVYVVLFPNNGPPPTGIKFRLTDTKTDSVARRPWTFPVEPGSVGPGVVVFHGNQMQFPVDPQHPWLVPPPYICLPPG